ncbi:MAG: hypothetical protein V3S98_02150 [Dehalococcoidia bacterium]
MTTTPPAPSQGPDDPRPNFRMPATDDFPKGPDVGELVPDFTLPDQTGSPVNFNAFRDGRRAMVMFHRSAGW